MKSSSKVPDKAEGKIRHLKVTFQQEQMEQLKAKAESANLNVSEFVRQCVTRSRVFQAVPEINRLTYRELCKIRTSIEQLTSQAKTAIARGQQIVGLDTEELKQLSQLIKRVQLQAIGISSDDDLTDIGSSCQ